MEKKYEKYSLQEKSKLQEIIKRHKDAYDKEVANTSPRYDAKKKRFVKPTPKEGYVARAVREIYPSLRQAKSDDAKFRRAVQMARRLLEEEDQTKVEGCNSAKKFRMEGGGRKQKAVPVRQAAFEWFLDVRGALKARLPFKIFQAKCKELYEDWLKQQEEEIPEKDQLVISRKWVRDWMKEYGVSLAKPNKRFALSQEERKTRLLEFVKNVLRIRYWFMSTFKKEPVIVNGDQMPLHRNKTSRQATLTLKNVAVYVKENYMLSRERATVFTQLSSDEKDPMPQPEFLFKGKGVRIQVNPPPGVKVQFAPKGSYRLENMLKTIGHMKNRYNMFSQKDFAIYILDDYSVHLQEEVRKKLLEKGYILVIMGGGITGDVQINDTHLHHRLKSKYRDLECDLMHRQLQANPQKVPAPSRDEMMNMLTSSWKETTIDPSCALKNNFILNALDGSEDYLVSDKLMALIGQEVKAFRTELLQSTPPKTLSEVIKSITPPKGVRSSKLTLVHPQTNQMMKEWNFLIVKEMKSQNMKKMMMVVMMMMMQLFTQKNNLDLQLQLRHNQRVPVLVLHSLVLSQSQPTLQMRKSTKMPIF
ncbi:steryl-sulfatase [Plakobranchus ocellatus]|uniref:Steryl-sulfatase n=1 Tax=Plakobranchus ocellatus TaxID=259542 RepID=A0AAV4AK69_9GAST|nr:steryl-sulfatase [Plakobranchus ocellatus]